MLAPSLALALAALSASLPAALSADDAVRLALANSPAARAAYESVGVARAEVLQAGLPQNPKLETYVRFSDDPVRTNRAVGVTQNILDLVLRPKRRAVAQERLEGERQRVADTLVRLAAEVKTSYWNLVGATRLLNLQRKVTEAADLAAEMARRQREAGNINALELATQQATWQQAHVDLTRTEVDVATARETLARRLGPDQPPDTLIVAEALPALPATDPAPEPLAARALARRGDLGAHRREVRALQGTLAVERASVLGEVNLGVQTELEPEGERVTGPTLSLDLPLFDRRQAARAKVRHEIRREIHETEDLELAVRAEVRIAVEKMRAARRAIESYQRTILPLQAQIVEQSQLNYNYMLVGVYTLLIAKQNELLAERELARAQLDYWLAATELERATGGAAP